MRIEIKMPGASRVQAIGIARSAKVAVRSSLAILCPLLIGCTGNNGWQPPTVLLDTPTGVTPIYSPAPAMPGGAVGPPPGLDNSALPVPTGPVSLDGNYVGTAEPLETGGGQCITTQQVSGFRVRGNSVRYSVFRGTIGANNGVEMVYGQDWIFGQFDGATFRGQLDLRGRFDTPGCTYLLNLQRAGA
ncbi:MAG TPA: hypothetical protein VKI44_06530 [Acetobacteraceae bacterium]|nr:hypothetical protein [Acetobacteraceae bacterium]